MSPVTRAGGTVPSGSISDAELASPSNVTYKQLAFAVGACAAGTTAATYILLRPGFVLVTHAAAGQGIYYFDPAAFAVAGLTTKYRINATLHANSTASTVNFTVGLYPVLTAAGGNGANQITVDTVVSGSTVLFTTPGATTLNQGNSGDFTAPAAGYYALGCAVSGTTATNSTEAVAARLEVRNT